MGLPPFDNINYMYITSFYFECTIQSTKKHASAPNNIVLDLLRVLNI